MIKLSNQGLWNYYPELTFIYTDCKVSSSGEGTNNVEVIASCYKTTSKRIYNKYIS